MPVRFIVSARQARSKPFDPVLTSPENKVGETDL
jgi:hypothetical protein